MVATPACAAFERTALPVPLSRLTIMRTLTPLVIIWSAMVWKAFLSFCAFWMSYSTPAALNAASRYLRSAVSHRAEDALSGRMTPTFAFFAGVVPPVLLLLPQADSPPRAIRPVAASRQMPLRILVPSVGCRRCGGSAQGGGSGTGRQVCKPVARVTQSFEPRRGAARIVVSGNVFVARRISQDGAPAKFVVGDNNMANGLLPRGHVR